MDMVRFVEFARSDSAVSDFLRETADDLVERHGAPQEMGQYMDVSAAWLAFLTPLLWFMVREGILPWVKLGWEWQELKRQELKKRLEDHAQELGLKPEPVDKAIDTLISKLEASLKNDDLKSSLMSAMKRTHGDE